MNNWVHIIGIAGVTTAGLAYAFKEKGWNVTGSDKGFYPPVSDFLKKYEIEILPGFKKERLNQNGRYPDLVIYQGTKSVNNNEEIIEAKRLDLKLTTYPQVLVDYVINKDNSIVVSGSFGKTTTTALLDSIFSSAAIKHSYMYGAFKGNLEPNVRFHESDSLYSIVEGDEYLDSLENRISKFFYYNPKYLIITGLEWDHQDLFPTFESYLDNFRKLIEQVPADGLIVANGDDPNLRSILSISKAKVIYCSNNLESKADWYLVKDAKPQKVLMKKKDNAELIMIPYDRNILGNYNDINILYAVALAFELNINAQDIKNGIAQFKGLKRRLEVRWQMGNKMIIDDFGSTPAKLKTTLNEIKQEFAGKEIYAVLDPAAGSRTSKALEEFKAHIPKSIKVILPRFSLLPKSNESRYSEEQLANLLKEEGIDCSIIDSDELLLTSLKEKLLKQDNIIVIFLGSHSFRGMITKLIEAMTT
jgi:UDP-N-acetylmuramate: L-alanyl-gamma-D-glutamyl-meso-diaminopimelate ligase